MSANRFNQVIASALLVVALGPAPLGTRSLFAQDKPDRPAVEKGDSAQKEKSDEKGKADKESDEGKPSDKAAEESKKQATPKKPSGPITALVNARIVSLDMNIDDELGLIESGTVLIQDGKILEVGADL
ncbi:MAG: hypothetical protein AAGG44_18695, partial [Planctomycetota bacterium]